MTFKLNHELLGGHVHIAVFSGADRDHLGKCGDLVMRADEWDQFGYYLDKVNDNFLPDEHPFIFHDRAVRQPDAPGVAQ
jgi:hypothetical protein